MIRPPASPTARGTQSLRTRTGVASETSLRRRLFPALVAFAAAVVAPRAEAQHAPVSLAEQLFVEGRTLMKQGEYAQACEKFKASYALDLTAYGTLYNLALCHEQTDKPASAW